MDSTQVRTAVARYFAAIRDRDEAAYIDSFAKDAVSHDPVGGAPLEGHDAIRTFFSNIGASFDAFAMNEEFVVVSGSGAASKWTVEATAKGGKDVRFEGIDIFEFDETGKIRELWAWWDPEEVMAQLSG